MTQLMLNTDNGLAIEVTIPLALAMMPDAANDLLNTILDDFVKYHADTYSSILALDPDTSNDDDYRSKLSLLAHLRSKLAGMWMTLNSISASFYATEAYQSFMCLEGVMQLHYFRTIDERFERARKRNLPVPFS